MGALSTGAPFDNEDVDGVRRYKVSIKVVVHSHTTEDEYIDISDDVMSASLNKSIKGVGRANLALTATKNFCNLIQAGDVVNIYFNTKDGEGWVRTFFGYVDRMEEEYNVSENGEPSSSYHLIASDWQKAIEKTQVYFNPHLARRADVGGEDFATFNIGGIAMISRGLQIAGSPSECVTSCLLLQLGFGSQWILPRSHPVLTDDRLTSVRNSVAKDTLLQNLSEAIGRDQLEGVEALLDDLTPSNEQDDALQVLDAEDQRTELEQAIADQLGDIDEVSRDRTLSRVRANLEAYAAQTQPTAQRSLLEIVNLTDFVEREAMDGYAVNMPLWQQQGPLMSIVRSTSNDTINELTFDLRPISLGGGTRIGTDWDRTPDDIAGNMASDHSIKDGVRYMPAVVMREYPYGTIEGIDGESVRTGDEGDPLGYVPVGAIFSNKPNEPGRHIVEVPNLHVEDNRLGEGPSYGHKIMDVAVISEKEIRSSRLGRSDEDHFNLFGMTSDMFQGSEAKYFMRDFIPIITPIHIARFGVRVREVRTRFARFRGGTGEPTVTPPETPAESSEETFSQEVGSPVGRGEGLEDVSNFLTSEYKYRKANGGGQFWHFHNGVDIGPLFQTASRTGDEYVPGGTSFTGETIPLYAIADGYVICAAPTGKINGYGNCVGIHHPQFDEGSKKLVSFYAHMHSIESKFEATNPQARARGNFVAEGFAPYANPTYNPTYVRKGELIGYMGKTFGTTGNPRRTFSASLPHLHFEITSRIPSKFNPDVYYSEEARQAALSAADTAYKRGLVANSVSPSTTLPPDPGSRYSQDPEAWFASKGSSLRELIEEAGEAHPAEIDDVEAEEGGGEGPEEDEDFNRTAESEGLEPDDADGLGATAPPTERPVTVTDQRRQLGRWCLLQDHWFQHNLEYLNGSVVMRPAPEIRVGYRLDILERNLSSYVETVGHTWTYPDAMTTSLTVTRGQPNNPFPAYALPPTAGFPGAENARREKSRLAAYFTVPDPVAVRNHVNIREQRKANSSTLNGRSVTNDVDNPNNWGIEPYDFSELESDYEPGEPAPGLLPANTQRPPILPELVSAILDGTVANEAAINSILEGLDEDLDLEDPSTGMVITGTEVDILND